MWGAFLGVLLGEAMHGCAYELMENGPHTRDSGWSHTGGGGRGGGADMPVKLASFPHFFFFAK